MKHSEVETAKRILIQMRDAVEVLRKSEDGVFLCLAACLGVVYAAFSTNNEESMRDCINSLEACNNRALARLDERERVN